MFVAIILYGIKAEVEDEVTLSGNIFVYMINLKFRQIFTRIHSQGYLYIYNQMVVGFFRI